MSKTTLIVTVIIIISLVLGGLFGFYFYLNHKAGGTLTGPSTGATKGGFFGFGNNNPDTKPTTPSAPAPSNTSTTTAVVTKTIPQPIPALRHLTKAPIAGMSFINKDIFATSTETIIVPAKGTASTTTAIVKINAKLIGSSEVMRWIDRATGNMYETSSTTLATTRISNTTIPKVYEAYFVGTKGKNILLRTLLDQTDVIETQYGTLQDATPTSTEQALILSSLPLNMVQVALSPDASQLFSILPSNIRGIVSKPDGTSRVNIFDSPFHEWLATWPTAQNILLTTKPSATADGFAYVLNTKNRAVSKIAGNKKGLTALMSPDGASVLLSESGGGSVDLQLLDVKTGFIKDLFIRTLPEKCVWSHVEKSTVFCGVPQELSYANYPDVWYQGLISLSDNLWKINTNTGESRQILQPLSIIDTPIDMINPTLNSKEGYIMFENKSDLSLWSYKLFDSTITASSSVRTVATTTPR